MNLTANIVSDSLLWAGWLLYLIGLSMAIYNAPWYRLKTSADSNILFAATVIVWLFWRTAVGITPGMEFHLLMTTSLTLMFGWAFAVLSVSIVQLGLVIEGQSELTGLALTVLVNGILPILVIHYFYRFIYATLPRNFFVYIFVVAFFGGALTMFINRLVGVGLLLMGDTYSFADLGEDNWFILLMVFPEAFLNGFIMTILVVYRPEWVSSFNDKEYLVNK